MKKKTTKKKKKKNGYFAALHHNRYFVLSSRLDDDQKNKLFGKNENQLESYDSPLPTEAADACRLNQAAGESVSRLPGK
jgi:hypothetical protein